MTPSDKAPPSSHRLARAGFVVVHLSLLLCIACWYLALWVPAVGGLGPIRSLGGLLIVSPPLVALLASLGVVWGLLQRGRLRGYLRWALAVLGLALVATALLGRMLVGFRPGGG